MSSEEKLLLKQIFADVFEAPGFSEAMIRKHFHSNYTQKVNGSTLNLTDFINHMKILKDTLTDIKITFEQLVQENDKVCTIHYSEGMKPDGQRVKGKVIAFFTFHGSQLIGCDELTHLVEGSLADKDLGAKH